MIVSHGKKISGLPGAGLLLLFALFLHISGNAPSVLAKSSLQQESIEVKIPMSGSVQKVKASIPEKWERNPQFGTVMYQPHDKGDYFFPPMIQFTAECSGICSPDKIPSNIATKITSLKEQMERPNFNTGDPKLDAVRANVKITADEKIGEDQWLLAAEVSYPEELSSAMYVPQVKIYGFRYHPGHKYFIMTSAHAHLNDKDRFLAPLIEAAKQTDY